LLRSVPRTGLLSRPNRLPTLAKRTVIKKKDPVIRLGQVNYTEAEEILQSQPVMAGMFTINSHPALVLFDSRASHSFMSMGFADRHNLPFMAIPKAYRISTLGAQIFINTKTDTVSLVLATHTYHL
jgi:hypothetical protein